MREYQIKKIGTLKYSRVESMSMLRKLINEYSYCYSIREVKDLLDAILNDSFDEIFDFKFKSCFDKIFDNIEYFEYEEYQEYQTEYNFPENFIPPIG